MKILIADDERTIRNGLAGLIRKWFPAWEIVGLAENGKQAIRMAVQEKPQIILADINMPEMNGLVMIEKIRSVLPETQVIILSGYDQFSYAQQGIRMGVLDYLLKPVDREELFMALRDAAESAVQTLVDSDQRENEMKSVAQQAKQIAEASFADPELNLNGVAERLHVSPSSLTRNMQKELGMSFGETVTGLRIEKACYLLAHTNQKMYEIAENCGYGSQHYFSRVFRKQRGVSPQEYRKNKQREER